MKTSEFLKRLQKIDSEVPFDADVVIGDDWMPQRVTGVFHDMPHTFIKVEKVHSYDDEDIPSREEVKALRASIKVALESAQKIRALSNEEDVKSQADTIVQWLSLAIESEKEGEAPDFFG